jgi:hypothetical protein
METTILLIQLAAALVSFASACITIGALIYVLRCSKSEARINNTREFLSRDYWID